MVGLEWYPCCRLLQPATRIPLQPNHTETPTHIEARTIRIYFWNKILHVSDSIPVHQEFSTVHTTMVYVLLCVQY